MDSVTDNVMDNVLETTIQAYLAQMDSAMKVSDLLAKHAGSEEITVDHIIGWISIQINDTND